MKKEERPLFPKEFAHIEQQVKDAQKEIIRMEQEIEKLSGQNWNQAAPAPKGMQGNPEQYRKDIIASYEQQIAKLKTDTVDKIKPHLANTDPRMRDKVIEKTTHLLDRDNNLKGAGSEKIEEERQAKKGIDRSSNFANTLHYDSPGYFDSYTGRSNYAQALKEAEQQGPVEQFRSNEKDITAKGMGD